MAQPPPPVLDLVQRFDRNRDAYRSPQYNETQLRREFLDPLFKSLGWDIDNEQGYAEAYKDAIRVGEAIKAPHYCFRIRGTRRFYLEAKRPSVDINNDVSPAYQLRRHAWTTKLPLSILSDFEEFAVYDCRLKPDHKHNATIGCILYIPYTEYANRWDEIAGIFSRDAVIKGSFDKFADSNRANGGTADVDDEFLKTIENWRSDLARNLTLSMASPNLPMKLDTRTPAKVIQSIQHQAGIVSSALESLQLLLNGSATATLQTALAAEIARCAPALTPDRVGL